MPVRAMQTRSGIKEGMVSPYSNMQIPPAADNPKERTRAMDIPVTRYHRPPKTAPIISEAAEA